MVKILTRSGWKELDEAGPSKLAKNLDKPTQDKEKLRREVDNIIQDRSNKRNREAAQQRAISKNLDETADNPAQRPGPWKAQDTYNGKMRPKKPKKKRLY